MTNFIPVKLEIALEIQLTAGVNFIIVLATYCESTIKDPSIQAVTNYLNPDS